MAIATGSQIRPELSAVDYTPFLQASGQSAQMQAQGITSAVGGALKGFESIVQQQKENKQLDAEIKAAERFGNAIQPFLKDVNPEVQAQFGQVMGALSDPNLSAREKSTIAKGIPQALNSILGMAEIGKKAQEEKATSQYASMLRAGGGKIPSPVSNEVLAGFTPAQKLAGEERYLNAEEKRANIEEIRAKIQTLLTPKPKDAPSGYMFMTDGSLQAIPGGPVTEARAIETQKAKLAAAESARQEAELKIKIADAEAKATSETEKKTLAAEAIKSSAQDARLSAETTLNEIEKARGLVDRAFAQGRGSGIGAFFSGSSANDLENSYDVIRANEALSRIIALKKASPTGSTGFGALNLKELETLQSRFAKLSIKNSDDAAKQSLNDLERVILKAFPDLTPKPKEKAKSSSTRSAAPMSPTQFKAGSRFEVMSTSP